MRRLALAVLISAVALGAQQRKTARPKPAAESTVEFPLVSVSVEGSNLYPQEKLAALTGLTVGRPVDKKDFEAARDRLVASGAFESVAYRYGPGPENKGFAVTFEVADIEQVFPVRFSRLPATDQELREYLKQALPLFGDRIPGTKEMIEQSRAAVQQYLAGKGQNEEIQARLTADRPEEVYILFHPAGAPPVVAEVEFRGNSVIPATVLQNAIHGVGVGVEYREVRFREILDGSIRPLYEERGRIRVSFPKIETAASEGVKGWKVTVEVVEGETYSFGGLRVEGTQTLNEELAKTANIQSGDLANMENAKAAQQRIHAAMRRGGYMRVTSKVERAIDDRKKTVDLTVRVSPGPQYRFGSLEIKGLDLHAAHEVKRLWTMERGQTFNSEYPDYFLNRLREDGIFDNLGKTEAKLAVDDKELAVDVTLVFHPMKQEQPKRPF